MDYNIWGSLIARNQTQPYSVTPKESVVVIAARMDATSMFDSISPGADSAATGIAAFFATVKHLMSIKEQLLQSSIVSWYILLVITQLLEWLKLYFVVLTHRKTFISCCLRANHSIILVLVGSCTI